jgi:hypothetical protein
MTTQEITLMKPLRSLTIKSEDNKILGYWVSKTKRGLNREQRGEANREIQSQKYLGKTVTMLIHYK